MRREILRKLRLLSLSAAMAVAYSPIAASNFGIGGSTRASVMAVLGTAAIFVAVVHKCSKLRRAEELKHLARADDFTDSAKAARNIPSNDISHLVDGQRLSELRPEQLEESTRMVLSQLDIRCLDAEGDPVTSRTVFASGEPAAAREANRFIHDTLTAIPRSQPATKEAILNAVQPAAAKRTDIYSFDVGTGKLKMKCKTPRGEVTAELPIYTLVHRVGIASGVLKIASDNLTLEERRARLDEAIKRLEALPQLTPSLSPAPTMK